MPSTPVKAPIAQHLLRANAQFDAKIAQLKPAPTEMRPPANFAEWVADVNESLRQAAETFAQVYSRRVAQHERNRR